MANKKHTLLPIEDIVGDEKLEVLKKYGTKVKPTLYAILTGAWYSESRGSCTV